METTIQTTASKSLFSRILGDMEFNRYVIMAHTLVIQSCAGSVAVYFIMHLEGTVSTVMLSAIATITMAANSVAIAQGPMKAVVGMCLLTVVSSAFVVIYALFVV